jgi:hypothetical protein
MPLEAGPLEVLGDHAVLLELLGERKAVDCQTAVVVPVVTEAATEVELRFREEGATVARLMAGPARKNRERETEMAMVRGMGTTMIPTR